MKDLSAVGEVLLFSEIFVYFGIIADKLRVRLESRELCVAHKTLSQRRGYNSHKARTYGREVHRHNIISDRAVANRNFSKVDWGVASAEVPLCDIRLRLFVSAGQLEPL